MEEGGTIRQVSPCRTSSRITVSTAVPRDRRGHPYGGVRPPLDCAPREQPGEVAMGEPSQKSDPRFGTHGRVLIVDLGTRTSRIEAID